MLRVWDTADFLKKGRNICKNKTALKKLLSGAPKIAGAMAASTAAPPHWDEHTVRRWAARYEACFR